LVEDELSQKAKGMQMKIVRTVDKTEPKLALDDRVKKPTYAHLLAKAPQPSGLANVKPADALRPKLINAVNRFGRKSGNR
jgi:hypothetical protein